MTDRVHYPDFADRMEQVASANPDVPALHKGRLNWLVDQLSKRFQYDVTKETARKWFSGETMPGPEGLQMLAAIMRTTPAYLAFGDRVTVPVKDTKARNAMASGAVNIVAGMIQTAGWSIAFASDDDSEAKRDQIDLYAIIRGARYSIHVAMADSTDDGWSFSIPLINYDNVYIVGVYRTSPTSFGFVGIDRELIEKVGQRKSSSVEVAAPKDLAGWHKIETFGSHL